MLHQMWFVSVWISIAFATLCGNGTGVLEVALGGCSKAIAVTLELCSGYMFFCGMIEMAKAVGAERGMQKLLSPLLGKLMPHLKNADTCGAVALNLSMNVMGMGNAATPAGLAAMRCITKERELRPEIKHDMEMMLILNATSLQLLPTTVLALRMTSGSSSVNAVLIPTIICTAVSTVTGVACGLVCRKWEEKKHAR